jgi:hypothetical protein
VSEKQFLDQYVLSKVQFPHRINLVTWPEPGSMSKRVNSIKELKESLADLYKKLILSMADLNPQINVTVDGNNSTIEINPPTSLIENGGALQ